MAEGKKQKRQGEQEGVPAVGAQQTYGNTGKKVGGDCRQDGQGTVPFPVDAAPVFGEKQHQPEQRGGKEQNAAGKRDVFPNGYGKDPMVGNKRIKGKHGKAGQVSRLEMLQGGNQPCHAKSHKAHLEQGIKSEGSIYVIGEQPSEGIQTF